MKLADQHKLAADFAAMKNFSRFLGILSGAWTLHIVYVLHLNGPTRFNDLRRLLGTISARTLTGRLKMLEAEAMVSRHYEPTVPPQVTYSLTERVADLKAPLGALFEVAEKWFGSETCDGPSSSPADAAVCTGVPAAGPHPE